MSTETKPKTETRKLTLNGQTFELAVKLDNRSKDKEERGAFLALDPKLANIATLNQFVVAAGQVPLCGAIVRAINKIIGPASKEGFTENVAADGTVTYAFDESKASAAILNAVADSVSAGKDELEAKITEARAVCDDFFEKNVMPAMAQNRCPTPEVVNRFATLRGAVYTLEKKLAGKSRPRKAAAPAAEAPAK